MSDRKVIWAASDNYFSYYSYYTPDGIIEIANKMKEDGIEAVRFEIEHEWDSKTLIFEYKRLENEKEYRERLKKEEIYRQSQKAEKHKRYLDYLKMKKEFEGQEE